MLTRCFSSVMNNLTSLFGLSGKGTFSRLHKGSFRNIKRRSALKSHNLVFWKIHAALSPGGNEIRTLGPIESAHPQSSSPAGPPDLLSAGISPGYKVPVVESPKFDKGIKALADTFTV
jgi:hypothetical protein